jgi:Protein of Unknown function (DUF2604)
MPQHVVTLTVIVNGKPTEVSANVNAPLQTVIVHALQQTDNQGQPPDQWELRDAAGQVLDRHKKVGDYGFQTGTRLFLNLNAGVGG